MTNEELTESKHKLLTEMMNKEKWKVKSYVSFIVKALVLLLITFQLNLLMALLEFSLSIDF